jgi:hypothetical protein
MSIVFAAPHEGADEVLSLDRVAARDRRRSAFHEAGHTVMAWLRGFHAEAMIKPTS